MALTARGSRLDLLKEAGKVSDKLLLGKAKELTTEDRDVATDHVQELLHVDSTLARQVVRSMCCLRKER